MLALRPLSPSQNMNCWGKPLNHALNQGSQQTQAIGQHLSTYLQIWKKPVKYSSFLNKFQPGSLSNVKVKLRLPHNGWRYLLQKLPACFAGVQQTILTLAMLLQDTSMLGHPNSLVLPHPLQLVAKSASAYQSSQILLLSLHSGLQSSSQSALE